jgi:hypothetical protein
MPRRGDSILLPDGRIEGCRGAATAFAKTGQKPNVQLLFHAGAKRVPAEGEPVLRRSAR